MFYLSLIQVFYRPPTYEDFFVDFTLDCNFQKDILLSNYFNYPNIKADFDGKKCIC